MFRNQPVKMNETNLSVTLPNEAEVRLVGADRPDNLRGSFLNRVVLDEIAYIKPGTFEEVIFPMLGTSKPPGRALFTGTPNGMGPFKKYFDYGNDPNNKDWGSFHFTTLEGGYVPADEVARAKEYLDPRTFSQEYLGTFENYGGQLYYTFKQTPHTADLKHNPNLPIWITADFNKEPMVWEIAQIHDKRLNIIDEIYIRYSAKTHIAVAEFLKRYGNVTNKLVYVTGDASNNYESHRDYTTDYIIIRDALMEKGFRVVVQVPKRNPNINNRINIVCSLLTNGRLTISPKCKQLIDDLNQVESDNKGGKNKEDPARTHSSDALDYLVWRLFSREFFKQTIKQI